MLLFWTVQVNLNSEQGLTASFCVMELCSTTINLELCYASCCANTKEDLVTAPEEFCPRQ